MIEPALKELCQRLSGADETQLAQFFLAFLTPDERQTLGTRGQVVQALLSGKPQRQIAQELGISISQISRGSAELKYGTGKEFFHTFFRDINNAAV